MDTPLSGKLPLIYQKMVLEHLQEKKTFTVRIFYPPIKEIAQEKNRMPSFVPTVFLPGF